MTSAVVIFMVDCWNGCSLPAVLRSCAGRAALLRPAGLRSCACRAALLRPAGLRSCAGRVEAVNSLGACCFPHSSWPPGRLAAGSKCSEPGSRKALRGRND